MAWAPGPLQKLRAWPNRRIDDLLPPNTEG